MLGVREMGDGGGGGAEWRRAVVMSHLLRADRMAEESWHVPQPRGGGREGEYVGRKKIHFLSKHTFIRGRCARRKSL